MADTIGTKLAAGAKEAEAQVLTWFQWAIGYVPEKARKPLAFLALAFVVGWGLHVVWSWGFLQGLFKTDCPVVAELPRKAAPAPAYASLADLAAVKAEIPIDAVTGLQARVRVLEQTVATLREDPVPVARVTTNTVAKRKVKLRVTPDPIRP
jgi:hypothetical protein